ncbi:MAG TPA: GNAT family protein [Oligoflexia bacterium]|nr:GNAT family protein [Oligoflexia bacterium]HMP48501.1 GNAT family protein [Oligoflexia bacterium]
MIAGKITGLRAVEENDLEVLKTWRNNQDFRRNFREVRELNSYNQKCWFEKTCLSPNDFMFVIVRLEDSLPIGACGLLYTNWILRSSDLSFYIGHENAYIDDKGFAEEACQLLLEYGFGNLNLNKVWMELYEFDQKKLDFFTGKFNFKKDGKLRENCYEDGRYWDSYILSLLRKEHKGRV